MSAPPRTRRPGPAIALLACLATCAGAPASAEVETLRAPDGTLVRVERLVGGLQHPWGMAFLPDGRLLVTERNTGHLYILDKDHRLSKPIPGTPRVLARGQGGLMDVALHPDFARSAYVYLSYARPGEGGKASTALGRGKLVGDRLVGFQDLFVQRPLVEGPNHFGNRIALSPEGKYLYLALGERFQFEPAQDLSSHLGKVIRLHLDGSVPADNPFVGVRGARPEIWSSGHRNIEAMALQPGTGALWVAEMGPRGGDELNRVERGRNYGWPLVSWGEHYDGRDIPDPPTRPEFADAARRWTPVISPSGMRFYQGSLFPQWRGSALIGGLSSQALIRVLFDGAQVKGEERLPLRARIRDVEEAPDGSIYLLTDQRDGGVWRLVPARAPGAAPAPGR